MGDRKGPQTSRVTFLGDNARLFHEVSGDLLLSHRWASFVYFSKLTRTGNVCALGSECRSTRDEPARFRGRTHVRNGFLNPARPVPVQAV